MNAHEYDEWKLAAPPMNEDEPPFEIEDHPDFEALEALANEHYPDMWEWGECGDSEDTLMIFDISGDGVSVCCADCDEVEYNYHVKGKSTPTFTGLKMVTVLNLIKSYG